MIKSSTWAVCEFDYAVSFESLRGQNKMGGPMYPKPLHERSLTNQMYISESGCGMCLWALASSPVGDYRLLKIDRGGQPNSRQNKPQGEDP